MSSCYCCICGKCFNTKPSALRNKHGKFCSQICRSQRPPSSPAFRFWKNVQITPSCWIWTGRKDKDGYGQFSRYHGQPLRAPRFAWEETYGPIPKTLFVLHGCDNPACVNPKHLFLGTALDNAQDCVNKNRTATGDQNGARTHPENLVRGDGHWMRRTPAKINRGEATGHAKLTAEQVQDIRKRYETGSATKIQLANEFSVSRQNISCIIRRKSWAHVP